jgi:hypothetical protein
VSAATAEPSVCAATTAVAACTAAIAMRYAAACVPTSSAGITACSACIATSAVAISAATIAVATATVAVSATAPAPSVPGSGTDKEAAREPTRSVIAVRRASVGVVRVIAPFAIRGAVIGGITYCGTDADSHRYLGICWNSGERQNYKYCQRGQRDQTKLLHNTLLVPPDS